MYTVRSPVIYVKTGREDGQEESYKLYKLAH